MVLLRWFAKLFFYEKATKEVERIFRYYAGTYAESIPISMRWNPPLRVVWLRRTLIASWFLAFFGIVLFALVDVTAITQGLKLAAEYGGSDVASLALRYLGSLGLVNIVFDLLAFNALWHIRLAWKNRVEGYRPRHLWAVVASVAMVLGRGVAFGWSFIYALIPDFWWLFPLKYLILPPVTLMVGGSGVLLAAFFAFTAFAAALLWLPLRIFRAINEVYSQSQHLDFLKTPVIGRLFESWLWFTGRQLPEQEIPPDESKGARFAVDSEIKAIQENPNKENQDAVFGQVFGKPLALPNEKHVLIMASTRSGKGVSLIIPHLLRYRGSAFVLDPKGENARATWRTRSQYNNKALVLDPFGISGLDKARFNPLARFTEDNREAESKALAAALILGDRDHWKASAQQLLAAFILFVVTDDAIHEAKKDLIAVRKLLLGNARGTLEAMQESSAENGLLSMLATSFLETPEKEFGSILSTAQRETEILDNPAIAACLAASGEGQEIRFADWRDNTMTVYLCLPAPKFPVFNRWLRLVLTSALDEMTQQLAPPPWPVCFLLDELATLGHLEAVENAVGLAAGYGVQIWSVFQDVAQMKDLYKNRWSSFIGNAGVRAVFNLDDVDTADYWSRFLGNRLMTTTSVSQNQMGQSTGQSFSEAMRPLLAPELIMRQFASNKMLVLPQGWPPIIADRVPYYKDTRLEGLWDDPRTASEKEKDSENTAESKNNLANLFKKLELTSVLQPEAQPPKFVFPWDGVEPLSDHERQWRKRTETRVATVLLYRRQEENGNDRGLSDEEFERLTKSWQIERQKPFQK